MRLLALIVAGAALMIAATALAADPPGIRGAVPLSTEPAAASMPREVNDDQRRVRNYPEQPPVIPHSIRDYQIDRNSNKCLSCHSRRTTEVSQAPMISITHFMDRDDQVLAVVSGRRYFCTQCHVPQFEVSPPIANEFVDIDTLVDRARAARPGGR